MRYGFIIVFNGAHTLRACAENALKSVDKLIIVEGAVEHVAHLSNNGRSTDGTMEIIDELYSERVGRAFHQVRPVIGKTQFWRHKLDMCDAALSHVEPGSWIIEFDSDEFYFPERLNEMMEFLEQSQHTCAEVWARHYYGSLNTHMPISPYIWGNVIPWRRMFRYDGLPWESHTPPRLGCKTPESVFPRELAASMFGVEMHHAAYVWRSQMELRAAYFKDPKLLGKWDRYMATGRFGGACNGPVRYDGPKPWRDEDFE